MNEQEQLYNLFIKKTNDELKEIINSENEYTEIAKKVAISILEKERGIELEEKKVLEATLVSVSTNDTKNSNNYIMFMLCFITLLFLISIIINVLLYLKISKSYSEPDIADIPIIDRIYIYDNNALEKKFDFSFVKFYNDNTFQGLKTTFKKNSKTGKNESVCTNYYGTYSIDKNALTLNIFDKTYTGVILDNGASIKFYKEEFIDWTPNIKDSDPIFDNFR